MSASAHAHIIIQNAEEPVNPFFVGNDLVVLYHQLLRISRIYGDPSGLKIRWQSGNLSHTNVLGRTGDAHFDDDQALRMCTFDQNVATNQVEFANGSYTINESLNDQTKMRKLITSSADPRISSGITILVEFVIQPNDPSLRRSDAWPENMVDESSRLRQTCGAAMRHPAVMEFARTFHFFDNSSPLNLSVLAWRSDSGSIRVTFIGYPRKWNRSAEQFARSLNGGFIPEAAWQHMLALLPPREAPSTLRRSDILRLLSGRTISSTGSVVYGSSWQVPGALPFTYMPDSLLLQLIQNVDDNVVRPQQVLRQVEPFLLLRERHSLIFRNGAGRWLHLSYLREAEWRRLFDWAKDNTAGKEHLRIKIGLLNFPPYNHAGRAQNTDTNARIDLHLTTTQPSHVFDQFIAHPNGTSISNQNPQINIQTLNDLVAIALGDGLTWNVCRITFMFHDNDPGWTDLPSLVNHNVIKEFAKAFPAIANAPTLQRSIVVYRNTHSQYGNVEILLYSSQFDRSCKEWTTRHTGGLDCRAAWMEMKGAEQAAKRQRQ